MPLFRRTVLLFSLNFLDALLTIVWVRSGVASEGNQIMAKLLDLGNLPFLTVKLAIGSLAALVLLRFADKPLARLGLGVALTLYIGLMGIHLLTGLAAFGYLSKTFLHDIGNLAGAVFAAAIWAM